MTKCSCVFILFFVLSDLQAQSYTPDSVSGNSRVNYAIHLYFAQRGDELAIYNGVQHEEYPSSIEGHAYFISSAWQQGSVTYDNVLYENMTMKYDLLKDQVIIAPNGPGGIYLALYSPRVNQFSFSGYDFIRLDKIDDNGELATGFYEELVKGKLTVLARRTKIIDERISGGALSRKFEEKEKYYLFITGSYYPVQNKESILNVLKGRRKEIQDFISSNKLNYRKNPELTIIAVGTFYNKSPQ
jgi:hypothetical protein